MVFAYISTFASKSGFEGESGFKGEYDVFLTFIGADVQAEFTVVLYNSMIDAGINVFRNDVEFDVDEGMDRLLQQSINNSKIYIPIFSRNYASSQWCLRELSQIVANTLKSEGNKEILPVFFDVAPDDVKLKTPLYRDAILNLKRRKKLSNKEVDAWRDALMEVDATKGWEMKYYKGHGELMKLIVEEVMQKLQTKHSSVTKRLVGIDDRIPAISKLLDINSDGVRLIKIHGMGGIGKTTLTKAVFNQLSSHFGKSCFLEDVRAKSSRIDGLGELQKELLAKISHHVGTRNIDEIDYGMKRTRKALSDEKVLIVLDDVDNSEQVDKLVGESTLRSGSRILITTRDKDVLGINRPKYQILDYEMEMMSVDHALELFSWHAFNRDSPSNDYSDISREIISTTGRLPLALEVIGSFLYRKPQELWKETLGELRKAPHKDVFVRLRISYNALTIEQQQIFLDIACFLIGEDKTNAIYMWRDCQLFPDSGVDVLVRMSLVKIVENNTFWMHDQLRDLGREIVRLENPMNPEERSRIWTCREVLNAIRAKEMNKNVQALSLDSNAQSFDDKILLSKENGRFEHLRFLKLLRGTLAGDLANCLPNLRWFSWNLPPQICEWTNMYLKNIVVLEFTGIDSLDDSRLRDLIERARKLKVLSLKSCHNISRTPNFSGCTDLERLTSEDCSNLRRIDGSIGKLKYLIDLKIDMCFCLKNLPKEIGDLVNLKHFFVQQCKVKKLPDSIWKLKSLRVLHFSSHIFASVSEEDLWELPSAIGMLHNLEVLLVNSLNLKGQLPSGIRSLRFLRYLNLSYTHVSEIPETITMLRSLKRLELMACHNIQELPMLPTSLTHLRVSSASLQAVPNLSNLTNLVELDLMIVEKE